MDWLFKLDSAYVDFLAQAYAAILVALALYMPFFGFLFRLGWWFADYSVRAFKWFLRMAGDGIAFLLVKGYRGVQRLWHKTKRKEDKE